jgi:hypothetical protein
MKVKECETVWVHRAPLPKFSVLFGLDSWRETEE